jgi:hypothetical protein
MLGAVEATYAVDLGFENFIGERAMNVPYVPYVPSRLETPLQTTGLLRGTLVWLCALSAPLIPGEWPRLEPATRLANSAGFQVSLHA